MNAFSLAGFHSRWWRKESHLKQKSPLLFVLFLLMLAAIVGVAYLLTQPKQQTPEELAQTALNEEAPEAERQKAVLELGNTGPENVAQLQRVLAEVRSPEVRAAAIESLSALKHWDSVPQMLEALDDPSPLVRGRAAAMITNMLGIDYLYRANDPPEKRAAAAKGMRQMYQNMKNSPPPDRKDMP